MDPIDVAGFASLTPRGPRAEEIDGLWKLMLWLGTATFVVFGLLLVIGLVRKRVTGDEDFPEPDDDPVGRWWLPGGGVALPSVVIGVVFVATVLAMQGLYQTDGDPLVIEVTGHQWWWEARYPDSGVTVANEINVPVEREVELRLTSADVIHSFWVPSLNGKIDALPDGINTLIIEAGEVGTHRGACAEFCGLQHAKMGVAVVAMEPDDFDDWLDDQSADAAVPSGQAAEGLRVFMGAGCQECHAIRGTEASGTGAPDLTHLASRSTIVSGVLANDRANLERWVTEPHAVKRGVDMPAPELDRAELDALIAYLEGLE